MSDQPAEVNAAPTPGVVTAAGTRLGSLSLMFGRDRDEIAADERRANGTFCNCLEALKESCVLTLCCLFAEANLLKRRQRRMTRNGPL
jgi:hypothetical protein